MIRQSFSLSFTFLGGKDVEIVIQTLQNIWSGLLIKTHKNSFLQEQSQACLCHLGSFLDLHFCHSYKKIHERPLKWCCNYDILCLLILFRAVQDNYLLAAPQSSLCFHVHVPTRDYNIRHNLRHNPDKNIKFNNSIHHAHTQNIFQF